MNRVLARARKAARAGDWAAAVIDLQRSLQQAAPAGTADTFQETCLELALQILAAGDFKARWEVAKLLPQLGRAALAPLIAIARDERADLEERWFAGRLLGQFETPEAVAALVELLAQTRDTDLAEIAASALAAIGPTAIAPLAPLLADPATCGFAATALAQIGTPSSIEPLLGVVDSPAVAVRATGIAALGNFPDPRAIPVLLAALQDYAAPVREAAAIGVGLRAATAAAFPLLTHLQPLLRDLNPSVCQQAAWAIGRLRDDAAAAVLATELQSELTPIAQQIVLARVLAGMESPAALTGLARALDRASPPLALEIARALGRLSSEPLQARATELLLQFFARQPFPLEARLAQTLAHTWGLLGRPAARTALEQLAQHPTPGVRLHARAALQALQTPDIQPKR